MNSRAFTIFAILLATALGAIRVSAQANGPNAAALNRCSLREVDSPVRGMLAADADNIYLGTVSGTLSAYEAKDLKILWRLELGGEFVSDALLVGNGIVVVTNPAGGADGPHDASIIRLISKDSGVAVWSAKIEFSERYYLGRLNGGVVMISRQGSVSLLDIASGRAKWVTKTGSTTAARPAFSADRLAVGTSDKQIVIISAKSGEILAKFPVEFVTTSLSFTKDDRLLVGDERGNVSLIEAQENKPIWKFKSGAGVSSALETDEGILITSLDNFVYLVSDYNGDVIWKRRLSGRVVEGGLVVNGFLVVLVNGENAGYVIDRESGKVTDALQSADLELINRSPIFVRDKTFALTTTGSLETYSIGPCGTK